MVLVLGIAMVLTGSPVISAADSAQPTAVFVSDGGEISLLYGDGSTTSLGQSAAVVGPMKDYDGDGQGEVPFVDSNGNLALVDTDGDVRTLASGAKSSKTMIASGDWDGDGTAAVLYTNSSDNGYLYRVEVGGSPRRVVAVGTKAALGVADFDGDANTGVHTHSHTDADAHSDTDAHVDADAGPGDGDAAPGLPGDGVVREERVDPSRRRALRPGGRGVDHGPRRDLRPDDGVVVLAVGDPRSHGTRGRPLTGSASGDRRREIRDRRSRDHRRQHRRGDAHRRGRPLHARRSTAERRVRVPVCEWDVDATADRPCRYGRPHLSIWYSDSARCCSDPRSRSGARFPRRPGHRSGLARS